MGVSKLNLIGGVGSGLLAAGAGSVAWSNPTLIAPGDTGVPIPAHSGGGTVTVLFDTGQQSANMGGVTVDFEEVAVHTSLNPAGVSFGFWIVASNTPTSLGATLPGFAGFMTAVESCDPFSSGITVCSSATGTASRSSGTGDVLTFAALGTTPVAGPVTVNASNVTGIFTDATGFTHPTTVTVTDDGMSFSFQGIAGSSSTSVPEPATVTLLGLGLLGIGLTRRRSR